MTLSLEQLRQIKKWLPPIPSMLGMLHDVDMSAGPPSVGDTLIAGSDKIFRPGASGGFDPNEDPVIIGSGATAGSGTPSAPTGGSAHAVIIGASAASVFAETTIIGHSAKVHASATFGIGAVVVGSGSIAGASGQSGLRAVVVGYQATAYQEAIATGYSAFALGTRSIAIGENAQTTTAADNAIAIGSSALADTNSSGIAIGSPSLASGDSAVAIGVGAQATGLHSVAIGFGVHTTHDHEIRIGGTAETTIIPGVFKPEGDFDATFIPTTNPGAGSNKVWNNSGVLTVA